MSALLILIMWNDTDTPLAYFISFRTYGTWLHGDERGSINRVHNRYRSPYIRANPNWRRYEARTLKGEPLILNASQRKAISAAIVETCEIRKWWLRAINVRTNHVHTVVTAPKKPELVLMPSKQTRPDNYGRMVCGAISSVPGQTRVASGGCGTSGALPRLLIMF